MKNGVCHPIRVFVTEYGVLPHEKTIAYFPRMCFVVSNLMFAYQSIRHLLLLLLLFPPYNGPSLAFITSLPSRCTTPLSERHSPTTAENRTVLPPSHSSRILVSFQQQHQHQHSPTGLFGSKRTHCTTRQLQILLFPYGVSASQSA